MSSPVPEPNAAPSANVLQFQALNLAGQKRSHAQDGESASKKHKKRKREVKTANLESGSSIVATKTITQSIDPLGPIAISGTTAVSPRKDKDKRKKKKRRKVSIVESELEEDRAPHKHYNSAVISAPMSGASPLSLGATKPGDGGTCSVETVAESNNSDKGKRKAKALSRSPSVQAADSAMARGHPPSTDNATQQLIEDLMKQLDSQSQACKSF
ncbi:hypothetical protein APHAL10511_007267 [Amanita phalloides]|nr:hypothetical protein APHAL10511_007267 [Amanita phalloides]